MKCKINLLKSGLVFMMALASWPARSRADPSILPDRDEHAVSGRQENLQACCQKLMNAKRSIYYLNARNYKVSLQLRGIYTRDETIFFCLGLNNRSNLVYHIDSIRFLVVDDKPALPAFLINGGASGSIWRKPAANKSAIASVPHVQSLSSLFVAGNTHIIRGKSRERWVIALPGFTLPQKKHLVIEVSEQNGGRKLQLTADNFTLVRARLI